MARKSKRGLVIADLHSGADTGLTHPNYDADRGSKKRRSHYDMRRAMWDWYETTVTSLPRLDWMIINGDAIDGSGWRSGGTEQLNTDRDDQCEMAVSAINVKKAPRIFMSYGTGYHTGDVEDWEDIIAREIKAEKIGGEDTININGLLINYRHFVGSSSIPHGRHTAVAKEKLWNLLWSETEQFPKADVILRSHVHYHNYSGGASWLAMTTPCLQGHGGKFGGRKMSGTIDIGVVYFDVVSKDDYTWKSNILRLPMKDPLEV